MKVTYGAEKNDRLPLSVGWATPLRLLNVVITLTWLNVSLIWGSDIRASGTFFIISLSTALLSREIRESTVIGEDKVKYN